MICYSLPHNDQRGPCAGIPRLSPLLVLHLPQGPERRSTCHDVRFHAAWCAACCSKLLTASASCRDCILAGGIPTFFDNRVPSALPFQDLVDWNSMIGHVTDDDLDSTKLYERIMVRVAVPALTVSTAAGS